MKKYFLIGILMAIVPNICFGASARFTQLAREKERKMAELEKCMGSTKGLKIAGISTLGLSAVGVAANVVEAKKIKDYDKSIESTEKQIENTATEIEKKKAELNSKNTNSSPESMDFTQSSFRYGYAHNHDGTCNVYTSEPGKPSMTETECPGDLANGEWTTTFESGEYIKGIAACAANDNKFEGTGGSCWCKITESNKSSINVPSDWVFVGSPAPVTPTDCQKYCAHNCAYSALRDSPIIMQAPKENTNTISEPDNKNENSTVKEKKVIGISNSLKSEKSDCTEEDFKDANGNTTGSCKKVIEPLNLPEQKYPVVNTQTPRPTSYVVPVDAGVNTGYTQQADKGSAEPEKKVIEPLNLPEQKYPVVNTQTPRPASYKVNTGSTQQTNKSSTGPGKNDTWWCAESSNLAPVGTGNYCWCKAGDGQWIASSKYIDVMCHINCPSVCKPYANNPTISAKK